MTTETMRNTFAAYRQTALDSGYQGSNKDFTASCRKMVRKAPTATLTPEEWVRGAKRVAEAYNPDTSDYEGPGITEPWEVAFGPRC